MGKQSIDRLVHNFYDVIDQTTGSRDGYNVRRMLKRNDAENNGLTLIRGRYTGKNSYRWYIVRDPDLSIKEGDNNNDDGN